MSYDANQLQLTHVLQRLLRLGGKVTTATGGGTTTVIDTKLTDELGDSNEDDIYNSGTIIVISDAGGSNAAPEGEFSRITDYVASSTTLTMGALTVGVASGDTVLIGSPEFPLPEMIETVNEALSMLGVIPVVDTSITTTANQTEHTLPLAMKGRSILSIDLQGITSDADNNRYSPIPNWKIVNAAGGSTGLLVLPQFATGYTIRVTYLGNHPRVSAYADYINEYLQPELVHAAVLAKAIEWRNNENALQGGQDDSMLALEQKAWSLFDRALIKHPIDLPLARVQGFPHWGTTSTDEFMPIPLP